jgi:CRISPR/Cas system-associated exonuclease Cas4 (RecB family)
MATIAASKGPRVARINNVSPSRAVALMACRLAEGFRAAGNAPCLPTHPKAHFGVLAHGFLCDAARGAFAGSSEAEIQSEWQRAVEGYEQKLKSQLSDCTIVPLARTCDDFEVNAYRVIAAASRFTPPSRNNRVQDFSRVTGAEVEGVSADRQIVGRLDRVTWEDGTLAVADIKTGSVYDHEGGLRPELRVQLILYSYLVHEKFRQWPKTLRILPLRGDPITVPFTPADAETLATEVKRALTSANQLIQKIGLGVSDESELASPSPEACKFCRYRPTCESYWSARSERPGASWPRDVSGMLIGVKPLGNKFHVLEIRGSNNATLVVRGIGELALLRIRNGMPVRVCDLKAERAMNVYSWKPTSFIWSPAFE